MSSEARAIRSSISGNACGSPGARENKPPPPSSSSNTAKRASGICDAMYLLTVSVDESAPVPFVISRVGIRRPGSASIALYLPQARVRINQSCGVVESRTKRLARSGSSGRQFARTMSQHTFPSWSLRVPRAGSV